MRILIVDDDPKYRDFVHRGLSESGMECVCTGTAAGALEAVRRDAFDLVLLDVMLPDQSGWETLAEMRARGSDVPVIFVTARDAVDERVRGLRMGGDDYIVKPFAFAELVARIDVARRRNTVLRVADLEIDCMRQTVRRGGRTIDLTRTEFALLRCLAESKGEVVSRSRLLQAVWHLNFDPGTNVVEVQVRRVRRKVDEPFARRLIHTVRGSGYVLAEPD